MQRVLPVLLILLLVSGAFAGGAFAAEIPTITKVTELYLNTPIVTDGTARAIIVAPADDAYNNAVESIVNAVNDAWGAKPEVVPSEGLNDARMKSTNIIAVGCFATNPVVEKLYRQMLVLLDWSWPGQDDAWVIRTVHNPWGTGKNVVYLGCITPAGAEAAAARFAEIAASKPDGILEPIIEVSTAGDAPTEAAVAAQLKSIDAAESSRSLGGMVASYLNSYFTTGHAQWTRIILAGMRKLDKLHEAEGDASDMRACREIFAQFDRIEEGPDFTEAERLELVNLFWRLANRLTYANTSVALTAHPHGNNWNLIAASYAGLYLQSHYPELKLHEKLLENTRNWYEPAMVNWKVEEDCPGYGDITLTGNYGWALAAPDNRFFDDGQLRKMADYDMLICNNEASVSGIGDAGGINGKHLVNAYSLAAWIYQDGRYLWWYDHNGGKPNRYWVPESILPREEPSDLIGIDVAPLDKWLYSRTNYESARKFPIGQCYDKVAFRSDLDENGQYMCMSGVCYGFHSHADANAIVNYSDKGTARLYDDGYMIPSLNEHNTVTILKDGWAGTTPELSQITANAQFEDVGLFESRLNNYNGVNWDRAIIWPKGRFFFIVDDLSAIEPGDYSFQCLWRTLGQANLDGRHWTSENEGTFHLIAASDAALSEKESAGFSLNAQPFDMSKARKLVQAASAKLARGQSYQFANLAYTTAAGDDDNIQCYRFGNSTTWMVSDNGQPIVAGINSSSSIPGVAIKARAFYMTSTDIWAAGATRIRIHGPLMQASEPVNVHIDLAKGMLTVECADATDITYTGRDGQVVNAFENGAYDLPVPALNRYALRELDNTLRTRLTWAAGAADGNGVAREIGAADGMSQLWAYDNFAAYANVLGMPGAKLSADRTPMTPEEAGYGVGAIKALAAPGGNVMFHDGETVTFDIDLGASRTIHSLLINSRQLKTFNGGCGVGKATVYASQTGFGNDMQPVAEIAAAAELEDNLVPYALAPAAPVPARYVRIVCEPYSQAHNVYLDSLSINGVADSSALQAAGFRMNAMEAVDVNGDGLTEVFAGGTDRTIHAVKPDGSTLWQYAVPDMINDLTVANSTGAGDYQIVAACEDKTMYSVNADGSERFTVMPPPRTYERPGYRGVLPFTSRLTVAFNSDINRDGAAEIIIGSANWHTYVYDHDGKLVWDEVCWAHTPTCGDAGDLDGDGKEEVVMGNSYTSAVIYSTDGKVIGSGGGSEHAGPTDLRIADTNGNGLGEIIVGDRAGSIWFQEFKGRKLPTYATGSDVACLEVGDVNGDGKLETAVASRNFLLYLFDADGQPLWQLNLLDVGRSVAIADVTGDAAKEIICGCEDGSVKIVSATGEVIAWFQAGGWVRTVAVAELDGNAETAEIVATCDDGHIYALQVAR